MRLIAHENITRKDVLFLKRHLQKALSFLVAASMLASSMPMTAIAGETTAKQIVAAYETGSSVFEANKSYTVKAEL